VSLLGDACFVFVVVHVCLWQLANVVVCVERP